MSDFSDSMTVGVAGILAHMADTGTVWEHGDTGNAGTSADIAIANNGTKHKHDSKQLERDTECHLLIEQVSGLGLHARKSKAQLGSVTYLVLEILNDAGDCWLVRAKKTTGVAVVGEARINKNM